MSSLLRLLMLVLLLNPVVLWAGVVRFSHLTQADGLPVNAMRSLFQDSQGFLWISHHDGISRYDGYEFRNFRFDPKSPDSVSDSIVTRIIEDGEGHLLIATLNGLDRYDPVSERFEHLPRGARDPKTPDRIYDLLIDKQGKLWIASESGVQRYDLSRRQPLSAPGLSSPVLDTEARALAMDERGGIWIGSLGAGLARYDPVNATLQHFDANSSGLPDNKVTALQFIGNKLWLGMRDQGVAEFEPDTTRFRHFPAVPARSDALADGAITNFFADTDRDGRARLWIATFEGGLARLDPDNGRVERFRHDPLQPGSLSHDTVRDVYKDRAGVLWVATREGLDRFDSYADNFSLIAQQAGDPNSLSHNTVSAILPSRRGDIWIGTQPGGLNRLDPRTGKIQRYMHDPGDAATLSDNTIWSLLETSDGSIWIGSGAGLDRFDIKQQRFERYTGRPGAPNASVQWLTADRRGQIWLSTQQGLYCLEPRSGEFRRWRHDPDDPASLSSDRMGQIVEDADGLLWIAFDGEINRLDPASGVVTRYSPPDPRDIGGNNEIGFLADDGSTGFWMTSTKGLRHFDRKTGALRVVDPPGLPRGTLYGVQRDRHGALWLTSNNGLFRYDPKRNEIRQYSERDGLQGNEYTAGSFAISQTGDLYFGGTGGLSVFNPEKLTERPILPTVVFTELRLYNRIVAVGSRLLSKSLNASQQLTLDYRDDVISLGFAGLDSADPHQTRYAYRVLGLNEDWIESSAQQRQIVLTDLSPGHYTVELKAANPQGVWHPVIRRLAIDVEPPPWRTTGAYATYGLLIMVFLYGLWRRQQNKLRAKTLQAERLRVAVDERTRELRTRNQAIRALLDSAGQGFLSFGADLRIEAEYSVECEHFLGKPLAGRALPQLLYPQDSFSAGFLANVLRDVLLTDDRARRALYHSLLPNELRVHERTLRMELRELNGARAMLVLTDISAERALESRIESERNRLRMVLKAVLDPRGVERLCQGFRQFCQHSQPQEPVLLLRQLHTFRGGFAQLEFLKLASGLMAAEQAASEGREFDSGALLTLMAQDRAVLDEYLGKDFLSRQICPRLEPRQLLELESDVRRLLAPEQAELVLQQLAKLRLVPFAELLAGYPSYVVQLAEQLGKSLGTVSLEGDECLIVPERFGAFASSLVHVFRNLVDHGIESPEVRHQLGKPLSGEIRCELRERAEQIELILSDDGAGIDWQAVCTRAREQGLLRGDEALSETELTALLFADGVTTRMDVSELSGRGVGLSVVWTEVKLLNGTIRVSSRPEQGTRFYFLLPKQ